jgi:hypothetical protein
MKEHILQKRRITQGRFFYSRFDMSEAKRDEARRFARAKREGIKIYGVQQVHCSCGAEGCWMTFIP